MAEFTYTIAVDTADGRAFLSGKEELKTGANHIWVNVPEGKFVSVSGSFTATMTKDERLFFNGYQTWTHCPEYKRYHHVRGIKHLPGSMIEKYHFDRYGDYHFVDYDLRAGHFHGESWCYIRKGEKFRLFASLDEEPGYTIFKYNAYEGAMTVIRDCDGVKCGGEFHAFDLYVDEGDEKEVFDGWFAAMGVKPLTNEPIKGYSSWYNRYEDISEQSIMEDLEGCSKVLAAGDLFQVDDGWEPNVGDWLETDPVKFTNGLKPVADAIHERGFRAGLWLAPFVAKVGSDLVTKHPDWLLMVDGKAWYDGINWGGFYSLDIDNPDVEAYIRETFRRVFDEWGFDLVKLDFLYGAAPFGTENESRAGRMIRAMKLLREVCGDHAILGCGVPVMTAFGLVEYCRVSCDVGLDWNDSRIMQIIHRERVSTKHALETSIFRRQLNGRAFLSDPDVFFLRDDNIRLTKKQKEILATVNRLIGGVYLCSDNMGAYDEEKKAFYQELLRITPGNYSVNADGGLKVITDGKTIDIYAK